MSKIVDYYVTAGSPYCYLAGKRLPGIVAATGAQLRLKPASMAVVFPKTGGLPVGKRAPARQAYRLVELARWRDHWKLPMNIEPKFFPAADANALRMLIAAIQADADALALANAFGACMWEKQQDIADLDTLIAAADETGLDGTALADAIGSDEVERQLESNIEDALAVGVFGVPWFVHDGINYWGQDRLDFLERALQQ